MDNFGKMAVFPGGHGRIGVTQHRRIWLDWVQGLNKQQICQITLSAHGLFFKGDMRIS